MTTIAYRDGIMAADSGCWMGDAAFSGAKKLIVASSGALVGVMGNAAEAHAYLEWVRKGCTEAEPRPRVLPDDESSFVALIAQLDGAIHLVTAHGVAVHPDMPYFACGAGSQCAFGALFAGASAEQAIEAAKEHASGAHGPVQVIRR